MQKTREETMDPLQYIYVFIYCYVCIFGVCNSLQYFSSKGLNFINSSLIATYFNILTLPSRSHPAHLIFFLSIYFLCSFKEICCPHHHNYTLSPSILFIVLFNQARFGLCTLHTFLKATEHGHFSKLWITPKHLVPLYI